jgi:hypothetical protein
MRFSDKSSKESSSKCTETISDADTALVFDWTYKEAEDCGFEWEKDDQDFVFR